MQRDSPSSRQTAAQESGRLNQGGQGEQSANGGADYYDKLGVAKIINAAGTFTRFSASIMPPAVQEAVARAAKFPVRLLELQQKAGEYLAGRLRCEAALVTSGAAAAMTLATAACVSDANGDASFRIPCAMAGVRNEVIVQRTHRYEYDHAIRNCGVNLIEVNTLRTYEQSFTDRTVMAHFFNAAEGGEISAEDWVRVAHARGVACLNDAAADVPPISHLWKYNQMGFDLVAFSGGKGIRGPQNAGLLLGRKRLIEAAAANGNPFSDTIGRGMKVAKEQIVGMVAALDWLLAQTDEGLEAEFRRRAERIEVMLADIPTIRSEICVPPVANHVPHLILRYDPERVRISAGEVAEQLRGGNPSIELHPATGSERAPMGWAGLPAGSDTIVVGVWTLQPGEEEIVAKRLREVLGRACAR
jgi:seryl-tRNA(Sec) selenium transferase